MTKDKPNYEEKLKDWIKHPTMKHIMLNEYKAELKGFQKSQEQYASVLQKVKEDMGDNYFDAIYTSNRYWVMDKRKMSDEKFQDILTLICEDLKKALNKHFGDLDNHSQHRNHKQSRQFDEISFSECQTADNTLGCEKELAGVEE